MPPSSPPMTKGRGEKARKKRGGGEKKKKKSKLDVSRNWGRPFVLLHPARLGEGREGKGENLSGRRTEKKKGKKGEGGDVRFLLLRSFLPSPSIEKRGERVQKKGKTQRRKEEKKKSEKKGSR